MRSPVMQLGGQSGTRLASACAESCLCGPHVIEGALEDLLLLPVHELLLLLLLRPNVKLRFCCWQARLLVCLLPSGALLQGGLAF